MSEQVLEWLLANDPSKGYNEWFAAALQVSAILIYYFLSFQCK